jgi:hypothetical protein
VTTTASGNDPDGQSVAFSLGTDAPSGASINPLTGEFSWTPGPEHALGDHAISVRIVDNGTPPMSDGQLLIVKVTDRTTAPVLLVPSGGHWHYLDNGTDQGTLWRSNTFNDASWALGPALLGYGTGQEGTTVSYGPNAAAKYITTYFRRGVYVPAASDVHTLNLRVLRNDGVIVYLNGAEVLRDNMPSGTIIYTRPAQRAATGIYETNWVSLPLNASVLRDGTNVIAAEIHLQSASGPDIAFDLELSGEATIPSEAPLSVVTSGGQATLTWPADGAFLHVYTTMDLTPPVTWVPVNITPTVSGGQCIVVLPVTTNQTQFFRLQTE